MTAHAEDAGLARRVVDTACPLDCPDSCSLEVTAEAGRVVKIDGSRENDVTRGYICAKVRRFTERAHGPERLLHPAVRVGPKGGGEFARVGWDEALDLVARKMAEARDAWGAESVLPFCYGGSNGFLSQNLADARLFRRFGASVLERTVCAAPTGAAHGALYGKMPGVSYQDYPEARLVVLWGVNPSASGIHLVPFVQEAQRRGAKLVVVDPRRTPLARRADLHLAVRPGTDLAVALSVHRYLFEGGRADLDFLARHTRGAERLRERAAPWTFERAAEVAGVDAADLERFAELYASTSPAVVRCGWGLERNRNGGGAAGAVLALPAVAGKFGARGGGFSMSNSAAWDLGAAQEAWTDAPPPPVRRVNMNHLGRALTEYDDPPVKVLFVYNCNPVATMPDQNRVVRGLAREDLFTVVFDQVATDTVPYADVVLPATTFLEHYDVAKAYGPIHMHLVRPAIPRVGESRPNVEVFADVAARLGLAREGDGRTEEEALEGVLAAMPASIGPALRDGVAPEPPTGRRPIQFVDVFPATADGKVDLVPEALDATAPGGYYAYRPDPATASYPLALISPASDRMISSTLGELDGRGATLRMHPADAAERGVTDGDEVAVFNEIGEVLCLARVSEEVRPGTVSLAKGLWRRHTLNGSTSNALSPDTLTDVGGGACFNDARVEVRRRAAAR
jgi:anaerobic selenocysteine-containing dehydrogenase